MQHTKPSDERTVMNPTNPNLYPTGRWTRPAAVSTNEPATQSTPPNAEIVPPTKRGKRSGPTRETGRSDRPLNQVVVSVAESQILEEARATMENAIRVILAR